MLLGKNLEYPDLNEEYGFSPWSAKAPASKNPQKSTSVRQIIEAAASITNNDPLSTEREWRLLTGKDTTPVKYDPKVVGLARDALREWADARSREEHMAFYLVAEADVVPHIFVPRLRQQCFAHDYFILDQGISAASNAPNVSQEKVWKDFQFSDEVGALALTELHKFSAVVAKIGVRGNELKDMPQTKRQAANWLKDCIDNMFGSLGNGIFEDARRGAVIIADGSFPDGVEIELSSRIYLIPSGFSKVMLGMSRELQDYCHDSIITASWGTLSGSDGKTFLKPSAGIDAAIDSAIDDIFTK